MAAVVNGTYSQSGCASVESSSASNTHADCSPACSAHCAARSDTDEAQMLPSGKASQCDEQPCTSLSEISVIQKASVPKCTRCLDTNVPCPKGIQYALAIAFIVQSVLAVMFATTWLGRCIWRAANWVFAKLANISDAMPEEIERSRREARIVVVSDRIKVVLTRRYVHGMRYWQDMAMTVVQLANHTIFYNPLPMPVEDMRDLARGMDVVVVVPNMYHHMFVDDYVMTFPSAMVVGSSRAGERHAPTFPVTLPSMSELPVEVELLYVDGFALDEYIMVVHSERLFSAAHFIACGIELSVGGATLLPTRLKSIVCKTTRWHSGGCLPLYERLTVFDKVAAASFVAKLRALQLRTCISAHGGICEDDAQDVLRRAWDWTARGKTTLGQPCTTA